MPEGATMTRTSHLFEGAAGRISEVTVLVAETPEEWDAAPESDETDWSVSRGLPTIAARLVRVDGAVPVLPPAGEPSRGNRSFGDGVSGD
jgi:hypothetical protein